ncbi:MAG: class I SAM-dependent methyltransferase [Christensenellaceae bacterium]|jgi:demethylmenaquinone methyltransferase/2-methoxy-6-polyprenyl-1,4-benzoquinol methylase|nr:class I SAM-dependent methyltransferase [Christensenellaceae bacterium]
MEHSEAVRAFFDRLAPSWHENPADFGARERIVEKMALMGDAIVADIGCGKGVMAPHLLRARPKLVIGVDLSGGMIAGARARFAGEERLQFLCGDFLTLPLPPLDGALLYNAYPHFLNKPVLAKKLVESLKPGGVLLIAHAAGRVSVNLRHSGGAAMPLSAPLRPRR